MRVLADRELDAAYAASEAARRGLSILWRIEFEERARLRRYMDPETLEAHIASKYAAERIALRRMEDAAFEQVNAAGQHWRVLNPREG